MPERPDNPPPFDGRGQEPGDDELVLYFYDELSPERRQDLRARLLDPALRARYDALCQDLDTVEKRLEAQLADAVPDDVATRAWQGIAQTMAAQPVAPPTASPGADTTRRALWTALAASVLVVVSSLSFQAGQRSAVPPPALASSDSAVADASASSSVDERVLLAQVRRHLGASERLLVDVSNSAALQASALGGASSMSVQALEDEKQWARTLLTANRLYRFAAERAGQERLSDLLGDLEPILIDLAHGSRATSPQYADALRESIDTRGLLPRVRAVQAERDRAGALPVQEETS